MKSISTYYHSVSGPADQPAGMASKSSDYLHIGCAFIRDHHKVGAEGIQAGCRGVTSVVRLSVHELTAYDPGRLSAPRVAVQDLTLDLAQALGAQ
jgi:hypothetical protein